MGIDLLSGILKSIVDLIPLQTVLHRLQQKHHLPHLLHHGSHVLPDSNAHFDGEAPEHLYSVSFAASDLWQHAESPADEVCLDLWDSYLTPA